MHDSLTPIGGVITMWNMMLNVVFGRKGVGFMNLIIYAMLAVFICGLMVGRTPEFLRRKRNETYGSCNSDSSNINIIANSISSSNRTSYTTLAESINATNRMA